MTETNAWMEARFAEIRPRAIAALMRQFRDLDLAEEAFASSCLRALRAWPEQGLPRDPLAWLLTVARNAARDDLRRAARRREEKPPLPETDWSEDGVVEHIDDAGLRDDVLRLLFICCHPELSAQDQSALALRLVLGLSVPEIARAFLVGERAMEQRITRAKRTVADANIPFETPDLAERHRRLTSVLLMAYLMFNEGWSASAGEVQIKAPLCDEAIRIARLLLDLFPAVSELMGLLALFLLQHSRREARVDAAGDLVLLDEQDRNLWDREMIAEARTLLDKALRHATPGRYQIQAAIAAVHASAATARDTDWQEIERLYGALVLIEPTPVVKLNHTAAIAEVHGPAAALHRLDDLSDALDTYRWFHTTRATLHLRQGDHRAALSAFERALSLTPTEPERRHLEAKITACKKNL